MVEGKGFGRRDHHYPLTLAIAPVQINAERGHARHRAPQVWRALRQAGPTEGRASFPLASFLYSFTFPLGHCHAGRPSPQGKRGEGYSQNPLNSESGDTPCHHPPVRTHRSASSSCV
jgi:hypothetical protein